VEASASPSSAPSQATGSPIYKAKRTWPPDFSQMSPRHQLRLERRYERRSRLKYMRPGWVKFTKLAQLVTISGQSQVFCSPPVWGFI